MVRNVLALCASLWAPVALAATQVTEVAMRDGKVIIAADAPPNFTTFTMDNPPRLVVDLAGATFVNVPGDIPVGADGVQGIKTMPYGSGANAVARIVITYDSPIQTDIVTDGNSIVVRPASGLVQTPPAQAAAMDDAMAALKASSPPPSEAPPPSTPPSPATPPPPAASPSQQSAAAAPPPSPTPAPAPPSPQPAAPIPPSPRPAAPEPTVAVVPPAPAPTQHEAAAPPPSAPPAPAAPPPAPAPAPEAVAQNEAPPPPAEEPVPAAPAPSQPVAQPQAPAPAAIPAPPPPPPPAPALAAAPAPSPVTAQAVPLELNTQENLASPPPPPPPAPGAEPPHVTSRRKKLSLVGLRFNNGSMSVFVRTNEPVNYRVSERPTGLVVTIENTRITRHNDTRPLDARFFDSPVANVRASQNHRDVEVNIELKTHVAYQATQSGREVELNFNKG